MYVCKHINPAKKQHYKHLLITIFSLRTSIMKCRRDSVQGNIKVMSGDITYNFSYHADQNSNLVDEIYIGILGLNNLKN